MRLQDRSNFTDSEVLTHHFDDENAGDNALVGFPDSEDEVAASSRAGGYRAVASSDRYVLGSHRTSTCYIIKSLCIAYLRVYAEF